MGTKVVIETNPNSYQALIALIRLIAREIDEEQFREMLKVPLTQWQQHVEDGEDFVQLVAGRLVSILE